MVSIPQRFCQRALGENLLIFEIVYISDFCFQIHDQRPKINQWAKFRPNWTKDIRSWISTWNDSKNCLMTCTHVIVMTSSNLSMLSRDFVSEYTIMPRLVMIGPQITEKYGGRHNWVPPQPIFDQKNPAWIGLKPGSNTLNISLNNNELLRTTINFCWVQNVQRFWPPCRILFSGVEACSTKFDRDQTAERLNVSILSRDVVCCSFCLTTHYTFVQFASTQYVTCWFWQVGVCKLKIVQCGLIKVK